MPSLDRVDEIYVLDLGAGQNVFNPEFLDAVSAALDEVVASPPPRGLVTTGSGKFFSLGFDLEWIAANPDGVGDLVAGMHELFARLLELPAPTVAALRRHTFAGGGLLALAHDYRVMREDRGYFGLPEVDVRIAFTQGTIDLVRARLAPQVAHEALTSGRALHGPGGARRGHRLTSWRTTDDVVPRRSRRQEPERQGSATYGAIKATSTAKRSRASATHASARRTRTGSTSRSSCRSRPST